jgi:hypothetical protein
MNYLHATPGALIALILFSVITVSVPGVGPSAEVQIILTIATFLFAILAGFFISRLNARYNKVRELVSDEDAYFLSLFKTVQIYGKAFERRMKDLINKYYVIAFDFRLRDYHKNYKESAKYLLKMWDEVKKLKRFKADSVYESLLEDLTEIEKGRNTSSILARERLSPGQWSLLIFLTGIILFSIHYLKTAELYSQVTTILLSTILILVLLIIRDLENFMLGGEAPVEESGEEVMETFGEPRYYSKSLIDMGYSQIPKNMKNFRLGLHDPGSERFDILYVKGKTYKQVKEELGRKGRP